MYEHNFTSLKTKLLANISKFCYYNRILSLSFPKQFSYSIRLLFIFTKVLVFFEIVVKLTQVKNNLHEQINPQWDCIVSKTRVFNVFQWETEKKEVKKFFNSKRLWNTCGK